MGSLSSHAENIKAAIKAAEEDGFTVDLEVESENDGILSLRLDVTQYRENGIGGKMIWDWAVVTTREASAL